MNSAARNIFILYWLILLLDLLLILLQQDNLHWFSKPLLMPLLLIAFSFGTTVKSRKPFILVLVALFLSWCGDMALQAKNLFIPGLLSFLLAHVAYITYFVHIGKSRKGWLQKRPSLVPAVIVYIVLLLIYLFPYLGALKLPVILYSLTIGTMLLMALNTRYQLPSSASTLFIAGALFFVFSDSLLAVNLFAVKSWVFGPFVMATYAAAQYLLVRGALVAMKGNWAIEPEYRKIRQQ